jgi:hypothetical protein
MPLAALLAAAGGLLLLVVTRRRKRPLPAGGGAMAVEPVIVATTPKSPAPPRKRAPALANVPSLEDESVAQWMRVAPEDIPTHGSSVPGSDTMKRRTQPRPRTTRDLQAGR